MPIYTKTGDQGETSLFGGKRVKKYDPQIESYGSVDELTSFIGVVIAKLKSEKDRELLTHIQKDLYEMMGVLCGGRVNLKTVKKRIKLFEETIDKLDKKLPKLTRFILPQGNEIASWFHVLRTVCRRAERNVVKFFDQAAKNNQQSAIIIVKYLNRLSDLFFIMARWYGKGREVVT